MQGRILELEHVKKPGDHSSQWPAIFAYLTSISVSDCAPKRPAQLAEGKNITDPQPTMTRPEPTPEAGLVPAEAPAPQTEDQTADSGDSDTECEPEDVEDVQLSTGVPPKMRCDPWFTRYFMFDALFHSKKLHGSNGYDSHHAYFRYRYAIIFSTFIGLIFFTCNTHRNIIALLCDAGF